ncbi:hypothetical protein Pan241w_00330 [Gimesia alba]|uniref:NHL repeat protein n=1 Tax=Gimesia alba TaxID=2527973 RepID=A0A517R7V8_9PLAN|nr:hypothetical protein [Gimesia alba]QDT39980.1 hypothetical protein Pan241w_00330 [Gimesia alba]
MKLNPKYLLLLFPVALILCPVIIYQSYMKNWRYSTLGVAISPVGTHLLMTHQKGINFGARFCNKVSLYDLRQQRTLWTSSDLAKPGKLPLFFSEDSPGIVLVEGTYIGFDLKGNVSRKIDTIADGVIADAKMVNGEVFAVDTKGEWSHGKATGALEATPEVHLPGSRYSIAPDGKIIAVANMYAIEDDFFRIYSMADNSSQAVSVQKGVACLCALKNEQVLVVDQAGSCFLVMFSADKAEPVRKHLIDLPNIQPFSMVEMARIHSTDDGSFFVVYMTDQQTLNLVEKADAGFQVSLVDCSSFLNRGSKANMTQVRCSETNDFCIWVTYDGISGIVRKEQGTWIADTDF